MPLEVRISGTCCSGRYVLGKKLGSGAQGDVYLGRRKREAKPALADDGTTSREDCAAEHGEPEDHARPHATGASVAIKLEPINSRNPKLQYEAKVYRTLSGGAGIPNVLWYGVEGQYNAMVLDLVGTSLEDLFTAGGRQFSLQSVLMLADQMINRIEHVHARGYVHRDIKPANFLLGPGKKSHQVYVIDFGLAKKYRDPLTQEHALLRGNCGLNGTATYASVNAHLGLEQSRRDDLEALGYMLLRFLSGSLPWEKLWDRGVPLKENNDRIMQMKMSTSVEELCQSFPPEFVKYLAYCGSLRHEDNPDYAYLQNLMRDAYHKEFGSLIFDCKLRVRGGKLIAEAKPSPKASRKSAKTPGSSSKGSAKKTPAKTLALENNPTEAPASSAKTPVKKAVAKSPRAKKR